MNGHAKPLNYLLFGDERELFAAHHIVQPPDFDQLLSVRVSGQSLSDEELQGGVHVIVPDRANHITHRLRAGEVVEGRVHAGGSAPARTIQLQVGTEFYLEAGERAFPATLSETGEKRAAGF